jgi:hypothetical protein
LRTPRMQPCQPPPSRRVGGDCHRRGRDRRRRATPRCRGHVGCRPASRRRPDASVETAVVADTAVAAGPHEEGVSVGTTEPTAAQEADAARVRPAC